MLKHSRCRLARLVGTVAATVIAATTAAGMAGAKESSAAMLDVYPSWARLAIVGCADQDMGVWAECVTHDLTCESATELRLYVAGDGPPEDRVVTTAFRLREPGYWSAKIPFLPHNAPAIELVITGINIVGDDMSGLWDVQIDLHQGERLIDAITESTTSLKAVFGNMLLDFVPRPEDAAKLLQFKQACQAQ